MNSKKEHAEYMKWWRAKNARQVKQYKRDHPEMYAYSPERYEKMKIWRKKNRKRYLQYQADFQRNYFRKWKKRYFKAHPEKEAEYKETARINSYYYQQAHKKEIREKHRKYYQRVRKYELMAARSK